MANAPTIFSVGHSNLTIEAFLALVTDHGIETIVDVRTMPYSQYSPQFNREELQRALERHGMSYAYAGDFLGGRPTDPTCYKNGTVPDGKADYLALVDYPAVARLPTYQRGVKRLLEIAAESRTAIMCSEEDPNRCHRQHLIAQTLLEQGCSVLHIRSRPPGGIEEATRVASQLSLL
ncbi:MAG TPA: DUF488 family protein [Thermomicrobiales bacterium]|nr:DUF488 family protein [Thermomicrobiales bacterium]